MLCGQGTAERRTSGVSDDQFRQILAALHRLEGGQANLDARFDGLVAKVDRLQSELGQLTARVAKLEADVAALRDEVRQFRTGLVEELGRTRGELMARMDRLQDALRLEQQGSVVDCGAAQHAVRVAKGAVEEVRIVSDQVNPLT